MVHRTSIFFSTAAKSLSEGGQERLALKGEGGGEAIDVSHYGESKSKAGLTYL